MAISNSVFLRSLLKEYYTVKGVQSLIDRTDPFLKILKNRVPVEGDSAPFAVSAGFGTCTANFLSAQSQAVKEGRAYKFKVEAGQLYAVITMNAKEIAAARSDKGGFQSLPLYKMNYAIEGMRRGLASALYGRGFGEIGVYNASTTFTANTSTTIQVGSDVLLKIPPEGKIVLKATVDAAAVLTTLTITDIGVDTITVVPDTTVSTTAGTPVIICLDGAMDPNGNPIFPVGLAGWVPAVDARDATGTDWPAYVGQSFYGVNRSNYAAQLCGNFVLPATSTETKQETIERAAMIARRKGLVDGVLVLNDLDRLELTNELQAKGSYFTGTINADKRSAAFGLDELTANFAGTSISKIVDSPYCPRQQFWLVDPDVIQMFEYSNAAGYVIPDGIEDNEPGKQLTTELDKESPVSGDSVAYGLNVDYLFDIHDGVATWEGQATEVDLHLFGTWAVINPSLVTTGFFAKDNSGVNDFSEIVAFYK